METAPSSSSSGSGGSNVVVAVRIRPVTGVGVDESLGWTWDTDAKTIAENRPGGGRRVSISQEPIAPAPYGFDHLFPPEVPSRPLFDSVCQKIVDKALDGYNGAIMCYGQTSSGKTHTMFGNKTEQGIISMSIQRCFDLAALNSAREFSFRVSFLEVYNEQVKDLLSSGETQEIKIQSHPTLGTVVTGNKEIAVKTCEEIADLIERGETARSIASTDMNEQSSRAHTLFRLMVESKSNSSGDGVVRSATLNLVDLAGSENAKMAGTAAGETRAREAKHINQSLLTLSLIIKRLSEESAAAAAAGGSGSSGRRQSAASSYMPYRDSKLTRLLESSLDGSGFILVVCNISPALRCIEETNNTLKFGSRAKKIKVNAKRNEFLDDKQQLRLYRLEIEQLKSRMDQLMNSLAASTRASGAVVGGSSHPPSPSAPCTEAPALDDQPVVGGSSGSSSAHPVSPLVDTTTTTTTTTITTTSSSNSNLPNAPLPPGHPENTTSPPKSAFFFEIDEDDDHETTLRMISEMEELIKRVAVSARSNQAQQTRSPPIAIENAASDNRKKPLSSPGSTDSSPPQYAPTWRDSMATPSSADISPALGSGREGRAPRGHYQLRNGDGLRGVEGGMEGELCAGSGGEDWDDEGEGEGEGEDDDASTELGAARGAEGWRHAFSSQLTRPPPRAVAPPPAGPSASALTRLFDPAAGSAASSSAKPQATNPLSLRDPSENSDISPSRTAGLTDHARFGFPSRRANGSEAGQGAAAAGDSQQPSLRLDNNLDAIVNVPMPALSERSPAPFSRTRADSLQPRESLTLQGLRDRTGSLSLSGSGTLTEGSGGNTGNAGLALTSVTLLLHKLKEQINTSRGRVASAAARGQGQGQGQGQHQSSTPPEKAELPNHSQNIDPPSSSGTAAVATPSPPRAPNFADPRPSPTNPGDEAANHHDANAHQKLSDLQRELDAQRLELRLRDADNKFLLSELDAKAALLEALTEGLREVEKQQETWLQNNEDLSNDLETAVLEIEDITQENGELREAVRLMEQAAEERGKELAAVLLREAEAARQVASLRDAIVKLERAREKDAAKFSVLELQVEAQRRDLQSYEIKLAAASRSRRASQSKGAPGSIVDSGIEFFETQTHKGATQPGAGLPSGVTPGAGADGREDQRGEGKIGNT